MNDHERELLRPVKVKTDGWDEIELPEGHMDIVQSLIKSHFAKDKSKSMDFNIVEDKGQLAMNYTNVNVGKGLTKLLHGAPGVGKTSTANN